MKVVDIAFTSYPVTDLKRARAFYEGVLGLKEARFFGEGNTGFVEYDIGPGALAIGNGAPDWNHPLVAVPSRWRWMILPLQSNVSEQVAARSVLSRWRLLSATWLLSATRTVIL